MLFNSLTFLWFFPLVVILYFLLSQKYRWILLLAASYYFYMCWKPEYILLILASTLIDYYAARGIAASDNKRKRNALLVLSLLSNLGILFSFKYLNFFTSNINQVFHEINIMSDIPIFDALLPVGISFYTFQTMSYTIDVYKGVVKPERHFGRFALFVSFFPQLVAGPIERAGNLIPQLSKRITFDYERVASGLRLM
ncbi:MAG: poly(beta-D-mannuronate) O-acetylase [Bacteroidota bacterium]